MKKGDQVYILAPGQDPLKAKVSEILTVNGSVKKAADEDCSISLFCPKDPDHQYVPFTVISDILPSYSSDSRVNAENPRISAMIGGYPEMYGDSKFMSVLVYDFVHGQYLVPAKTAAGGHTTDITEPIRGSHEVAFLSVSTSARPDSPVFPLFTDWNALSKYKAVMDDEDSITLVMNFQQAVAMMSKGYEGMVINPFGPGSFFLSEPFIGSITKLDGYREEFVLKENGNEK